MLIVGVIAFAAAELLYGGRGSDSGALQFVLLRPGRAGTCDAAVVAGAGQEGGVKRSARYSQWHCNATHCHAGAL